MPTLRGRPSTPRKMALMLPKLLLMPPKMVLWIAEH
jgi:hypothetical protein